MIAAHLAGVEVTEHFTTLDDFKKSEQGKKCLLPTLPALEGENGEMLTSSVAIARYLASFKSELLGANEWEQAQVEQWMLLLRNET